MLLHHLTLATLFTVILLKGVVLIDLINSGAPVKAPVPGLPGPLLGRLLDQEPQD